MRWGVSGGERSTLGGEHRGLVHQCQMLFHLVNLLPVQHHARFEFLDETPEIPARGKANALQVARCDRDSAGKDNAD